MYTESIDTKVKYKRSTDRLKSIAFLKGLAICMVVLVHSRQRIPVDYSGYNAAGKVLAYIGKYIGEYGQFGCQLFFVISALTLCMSWNNKYGISDSGLKPANILSFYKKRFLAIAPGYYTIIFVGYIVNRFIFDNLSISKNLMLQTNQSIYAIIANVLFCNGLVPGGNNNVVFGGWYVGTSMIFYACFPFLYLFVSKCRQISKNRYKMVVLTSVILWVFVYWMWCMFNNMSFNIENNSFAYFFIGNQMPVLLCGMVLFFYERRGGIRKCKISSS